MDEQQLQKLRKELEEERDSLNSMLEDMPEDFSRDDEDNLDVGMLGSDYQDIERKSRVRRELQERLDQIEATIRQIDGGTYPS